MRHHVVARPASRDLQSTHGTLLTLRMAEVAAMLADLGPVDDVDTRTVGEGRVHDGVSGRSGRFIRSASLMTKLSSSFESRNRTTDLNLKDLCSMKSRSDAAAGDILDVGVGEEGLSTPFILSRTIRYSSACTLRERFERPRHRDPFHLGFCRCADIGGEEFV